MLDFKRLFNVEENTFHSCMFVKSLSATYVIFTVLVTCEVGVIYSYDEFSTYIKLIFCGVFEKSESMQFLL